MSNNDMREALERLFSIRGYDQLDTEDTAAIDVAIDALQQSQQAQGEAVMTIAVGPDGVDIETNVPAGLPEGTYHAYIGQLPAPSVVPEGYTLAPKEATYDMIKAARDHGAVMGFSYHYHKALEAAPSPADQKEG